MVDALALRRVRVGVKVGDFFSAEDTLELCRQLRAREVEFAAITPLEWSTILHAGFASGYGGRGCCASLIFGFRAD